MLDPASGAVTVLAPTKRDAVLRDEPFEFVYSVWWDSKNKRVYANDYAGGGPCGRGWVLTPDGWQAPRRWYETPTMILFDNNESLSITVSPTEVVFSFGAA